MNHIVIKGRLTKDPEMRQTEAGLAVCNASVAVNRKYSKNDETDFFSCTFWRQAAEFVGKYFTKGQEILVEGEMQSRKYTDKDGINRTVWEIVGNAEFCGSKAQGGGSSNNASSGNYAAKTYSKPAPPTVETADDDDGDLPF